MPALFIIVFMLQSRIRSFFSTDVKTRVSRVISVK